MDAFCRIRNWQMLYHVTFSFPYRSKDMSSVLRKYEMTGFEWDTFSSIFWFTAWHVWPKAKQPLLVASGFINRQGQRTAAGGGTAWINSINIWLLLFFFPWGTVLTRRETTTVQQENWQQQQLTVPVRDDSASGAPSILQPPRRLPACSVALPIW